MDLDLKEARKRGNKITQEMDRTTQEAARLKAQEEQAANRARDLLAGATLEQVEIPRKTTTGAARRAARGSAAAAAAAAAGAGPTDMDVDGDEGEEEGGGDAGGGGAQMSLDEELEALDFGRLSDEHRSAKDANAREALER